jgi:hypothetical protein
MLYLTEKEGCRLDVVVKCGAATASKVELILNYIRGFELYGP